MNLFYQLLGYGFYGLCLVLTLWFLYIVFYTFALSVKQTFFRKK